MPFLVLFDQVLSAGFMYLLTSIGKEWMQLIAVWFVKTNFLSKYVFQHVSLHVHLFKMQNTEIKS